MCQCQNLCQLSWRWLNPKIENTKNVKIFNKFFSKYFVNLGLKVGFLKSRHINVFFCTKILLHFATRDNELPAKNLGSPASSCFCHFFYPRMHFFASRIKKTKLFLIALFTTLQSTLSQIFA